MKMPIPNDWDGISECAYEVRWPDSTLWRIILRGLLSNPSLVDFWDQNTGDVAQVLADFEPFLNFALSNLECGAMYIPIGTVLEFAGTALPDKFLWCDGSHYPIADYPDLYAAIADTYHPGGVFPPDHFFVPDRRGRVGVGRKAGDIDFQSVGRTGGLKSITLDITQIPAHSHGLKYATGAGGVSARYAPGVTVGGVDTSIMEVAGGGQSHNNLQPYITANYIIRAQK